MKRRSRCSKKRRTGTRSWPGCAGGPLSCAGDHAAAIRHFREALTDAPYDRVAISELGKALVLAGDRPAASEYQTQARRLDDVYNLINRVSRPDRENQLSDLTRLGKACEAAGLREEAQGWYELAIAREPLDAEAQQGLRRLRDENGSPATERGRSSRPKSGGSVVELDAGAIAFEDGQRLERTADHAFLPEARGLRDDQHVAAADAHFHRDFTRSPSVSRICFSIFRLIAASVSGSDLSSAVPLSFCLGVPKRSSSSFVSRRGTEPCGG